MKKILIVSFSFPPSNVVGAIRVGKLARYLYHHGYDVRVLTSIVEGDESLPLEIPRERVCAEYRPRGHWLDPLVRCFRRRPTAPLGGVGETPAIETSMPSGAAWGWLQRQYYALSLIPDIRADWIKTAVPAGTRLIKGWRPDIIFASAPPFTGLIVASRLGRTFNIPWVADFRDLWVDNPYYDEPVWRRPIDVMLECRLVRNTAGLVTVSPVWAEQLRRRHCRPAEVVYNGYAEEDFPQPPLPENPGKVLTIRYMGSIYQGFRDPSPLFAAIGLLGDEHRDHVKVEFFGSAVDGVLASATEYRVRDCVYTSPRVPYRRSLELQMTADVLLLLQWSDKRDEGNLPGKIFEYFYARRPILLIGYEKGVAARMIRERGAGFVSNSPEGIRDKLVGWIEAKRAGRLRRLDPSVYLGLSRDDQFLKIEHLFAKILKKPRAATTS